MPRSLHILLRRGPGATGKGRRLESGLWTGVLLEAGEAHSWGTWRQLGRLCGSVSGNFLSLDFCLGAAEF